MKWSEVGPDIYIKKKKKTTQQRLIYSQCGEPQRAVLLLNWGLVALSFPGGSAVKESSCRVGVARDMDLIPGSGRSPEEGNGYPLQYSFLENPLDRGSWQAIQSIGSQSLTRVKRLSAHAYLLYNVALVSAVTAKRMTYMYAYTPSPWTSSPPPPSQPSRSSQSPALLRSAVQQLPTSYLLYTQ